MAWTSPRTWIAGETPTATILNTHIRDNFKALGDAWTTYTPTWSTTGTAPALGNGTLTGGYISTGKRFEFWMELVAGSTTTYGTGAWSFSMPVTLTDHRWQFNGTVFDTSAANFYPCMAGYTGPIVETITPRVDPTTAGNQQRTFSAGTIPFTWATGDLIFLSGSAEAA